MDTKQEHGLSFDENSNGVYEEILVIARQDYDKYRKVIRAFLEGGATAWEGTYTLEYIEENLREGTMVASLLHKDDNYKALMITTIRDYGEDTRALRIEILIATSFFHTARAYATFEARVKELGFAFIEAKTHPTIAAYMVNKRGYTCPGVYIRRDLRPSRRN